MSATPRVLSSARGERLAGLLHEPEDGTRDGTRAPRGLAVISPCFTCTKDIAPVRNLARDLAAAGFRALRYDPIGTGASDGRFEDATLSRYRDDLVAVVREVSAGEPLPLHLIGHSLGGTTSLLAAEELAPRTVVTLGTNARRDSLRRLLGAETFERAKNGESVTFDPGDGVPRPLTAAFAADLETHDVLSAAERLRCPLLVVHGDRDALVPLAAAEELAERAGAELAIVPGGAHLLARREDRERILSVVLAFIERHG